MTRQPRPSLPHDSDFGSHYLPQAPWLLALIGPGLFLRGFDSPIGQASACLIASFIVAALVLSAPPPPLFWRSHRLALGLCAAALAWLLLVAGMRTWILPDSEFPLALDLFPSKFLGTLAGFWALLLGLLSARLPKLWLSPADWIVLLVTLHAAIGLGLALQSGPMPWEMIQRGRFVGMLANANVTACTCGAACVLAWGNVLRSFDERTRDIGTLGAAASLLAVAINAIVVTLTASRLAVLLTLVAMAAITVLSPRARKRRRRQVLSWLLLIGGAILIAQTQIAEGLVDRLELARTDAGIRWTIWSHFGQAIPAAIWTGYGSGSLSSLNFYTLTELHATERLWTINSPHNIAIQILLVGGLPYLLLLTAGALLILRDVVRAPAWRQGDARFMALVGAASVILVDGAFDIALDVPVTVCLFTILIGLAWGRAFAEGQSTLLLADLRHHRS